MAEERAVWQINVDEEQLLFLTTLFAMFNYAIEGDDEECAKGFTAAMYFAEALGTRYQPLWEQLKLLTTTTPKFADYDNLVAPPE
jgi:hypothetical protein